MGRDKSIFTKCSKTFLKNKHAHTYTKLASFSPESTMKIIQNNS